MPIEFDEELVSELRRMLGELENPVKLYFFTDPDAECAYCEDIREILSLLSGVSPKIRVVEGVKGSREAERLEVPMYPAIVVHGVEEYNIRFFGAPAGYEFGALVEDIVDASRGEPRGLPPKLAEALRRHVRRKTRIKVFVTPTCPYCPLAVRAAHRYAMVNKLIYGDMIEAMEFPELANKYSVYAVPKVVIEVEGEDKLEFEGALPDAPFIAEILRAHGVRGVSDLVGEGGGEGS
ncbi:MAG: glutaredoxin [Thermoprotei archaeon]|nr:MAG: glutaredoxin [Thermoprotei archaeon]